MATSQRSASPSVPSITRHFIVIFTIVFERKSEISEPAMPKMNENASRGAKPPSPRDAARSTPHSAQITLAAIVSIATAAMFVIRKRNSRFIPRLVES